MSDIISQLNELFEIKWQAVPLYNETNGYFFTIDADDKNRIISTADSALTQIKRLQKALQYCRDFWGEFNDDENGAIHDCTGESCVICNIEKILKQEQG